MQNREWRDLFDELNLPRLEAPDAAGVDGRAEPGHDVVGNFMANRSETGEQTCACAPVTPYSATPLAGMAGLDPAIHAAPSGAPVRELVLAE